MKVVILCGGKETRLGFETKIIPKPMALLDKDPIILHIINYYKKFGYTEFILAIGYKGDVIREYFKKKKIQSINVKCVETGKDTLTGSRLLKLKNIYQKKKILWSHTVMV